MKIYRLSVAKTLYFYEKFVLPEDPHRRSLLELKRDEFKDRVNLLNPYQSDLVIAEKRELLEKRANASNIKNFKI